MYTTVHHRPVQSTLTDNSKKRLPAKAAPDIPLASRLSAAPITRIVPAA
jgi:hypothetical protein